MFSVVDLPLTPVRVPSNILPGCSSSITISPPGTTQAAASLSQEMASLFVSACDSVPKGRKARWAVLPALCRLKSRPCKCILVKHEALGVWDVKA